MSQCRNDELTDNDWFYMALNKIIDDNKEKPMTMWDDAMHDCLSENKMHDEHYRSMPIEPLEVMQAVLTPEEYRGFLKGNIIKYSMRAGRKAGEPVDKEVDKARNYQQLLDAYDSYQE